MYLNFITDFLNQSWGKCLQVKSHVLIKGTHIIYLGILIETVIMEKVLFKAKGKKKRFTRIQKTKSDRGQIKKSHPIRNLETMDFPFSRVIKTMGYINPLGQ